MTGHWILAAIVSMALLLILAFTSAGNSSTVWWVVLIGIALYWLSLVGLALYRKWAKYYELTSQQLKHRDGIFIRTLNRIELIDIDDVMYKQGPIQAILGVGNIRVTSSDASHPDLVMHGISNIKHVADLIDDARRDERRSRGLHIEAI